MKSTKRSLAMALALSFGVFGVACSPAESDNNNGGSGGSKGGSGGSTGGRGGSTGGSSSTGGSTGGSSSTGGSGGSTGGSGGSSSTGGTGGSGGSGGSTGGSGGSTGGSSGSGGSGGSGGSTGGTGGSMTDAGKTDGSSGAETGGGSGGFALTVTGFTPGANGRNCYPPGSNDMGNKSPKLDWGPTPPGTMSWVLTTEDKSDMGPHQVVCNIPPSFVGQPMDVKGMIPAGAEKGTRHNKPDHMWYGPGAGNVRQYEIRIWAIPTAKLPMSCAGSAGAIAAFRYLKMNMENKAAVLATDGKSFWGNRTGACQ